MEALGAVAVMGALVLLVALSGGSPTTRRPPTSSCRSGRSSARSLEPAPRTLPPYLDQPTMPVGVHLCRGQSPALGARARDLVVSTARRLGRGRLPKERGRLLLHAKSPRSHALTLDRNERGTHSATVGSSISTWISQTERSGTTVAS